MAAETTPANASGAHILALDGVRGLAILAVMAYRFGLQGDFYHSGLASDQLPFAVERLLAFGSRGVDLFFVLSGFLITGLLSDAKSKEHFFRNFYIRRLLRIFPLYYAAMLLFTAILPALSSNTFPIGYAREDQAYLWLHSANLGMLTRGDWCYGRLDHFWSLAIEEHFYLLWPCVIYCLSPRQAKTICLWGVASSPFLRMAWKTAGLPDVALDTFTPLRMDGLLAGSFVALAMREAHGPNQLRKWAGIVCACCLLLVLPAAATTRRFYHLPETFYAVAFAAFLAIVLNSHPTGALKRVLQFPGLRFFGKYSYAMYIFQAPLVPLVALVFRSDDCESLCGSFLAGRLLYAMLLGFITTVVALASWHLLEKHCLAWKDILAPRNPHERKPVLRPLEIGPAGVLKESGC